MNLADYHVIPLNRCTNCDCPERDHISSGCMGEGRKACKCKTYIGHPEKDKRTPGDKALDQLLELANTFEAWSIDDTTLQEGIDWRDAAHKARQAADAVARATANWKKKNRASE